MPAKVFPILLLITLTGISISRSVPVSYQVDGGLNKQANAGLHPDITQRTNSRGLVRRDWPSDLTRDQKHLISQFLPHLYAAELAGKENNLQNSDIHFPSWMDFGRRSSEDMEGDN
uniref:Gastrin/cholecystokinin peptide hormone domain-containing protein n=1 Tax=Salvator merianae TaxID=96440 RepID=A0A8D0B7H1_SALMN